MNLPGMGDRYPYQLSGGQQQRVALARALATEPRVLLLDEPLSSLDAALRETMRTELVQIFRRLKITTINVTHDQDEAMSMSDRIMVLRDGQVQQVGTPTELYLNPANLFVASFMGAANLLPGQIKQTTSQAASEYISLHLISSSSEQQVFTGLASHAIRQQLNGHASILCRPDDVLIHRTAAQFKHSNILPGTVSHVSFVGGRWHTQVRLAEVESQSLLIYAPFQPEVHQQVWLELPPDRCRIVPR